MIRLSKADDRAEALRLAQQAQKTIADIEQHAIVMAPVPALLPQMLASPPAASSGPLAALGDVAYGGHGGKMSVRIAESRGTDSSRSWLPLGFTPLENTGPEVDGIADLFKELLKDGDTNLFKEDQANEGTFRQQAQKSRWLHLATHAFYAPDLMTSALGRVEAKPGEGDAATAPPQGVTFHPGLLSGLALAGANVVNAPDEDDGILSAMEVAALDDKRHKILEWRRSAGAVAQSTCGGVQ